MEYPKLWRPKKKLCFVSKDSSSKHWEGKPQLQDVDKLFDDLDAGSGSEDTLLALPLCKTAADEDVKEGTTDCQTEKHSQHQMNEEQPHSERAPVSPQLVICPKPLKTSSPIEQSPAKGVNTSSTSIVLESEDDAEEPQLPHAEKSQPSCSASLGLNSNDLESPPANFEFRKSKSPNAKMVEDSPRTNTPPPKVATSVESPPAATHSTPKSAKVRGSEESPSVEQEREPDPPHRPTNNVAPATESSDGTQVALSAFLQRVREAARPRHVRRSPVRAPTPPPEPFDDFMILDAPAYITIPRKKLKKPQKSPISDKDDPSEKLTMENETDAAQKTQQKDAEEPKPDPVDVRVRRQNRRAEGAHSPSAGRRTGAEGVSEGDALGQEKKKSKQRRPRKRSAKASRASEEAEDVPGEEESTQDSGTKPPAAKSAVKTAPNTKRSKGKAARGRRRQAAEDRRGQAKEDGIGQAEEDRRGQAAEDRRGQATEEDRIGQGEKDRIGQEEEDRIGQVEEDRGGQAVEDRRGEAAVDRRGQAEEDNMEQQHGDTGDPGSPQMQVGAEETAASEVQREESPAANKQLETAAASRHGGSSDLAPLPPKRRRKEPGAWWMSCPQAGEEPDATEQQPSIKKPRATQARPRNDRPAAAGTPGKLRDVQPAEAIRTQPAAPGRRSKVTGGETASRRRRQRAGGARIRRSGQQLQNLEPKQVVIHQDLQSPLQDLGSANQNQGQGQNLDQESRTTSSFNLPPRELMDQQRRQLFHGVYDHVPLEASSRSPLAHRRRRAQSGLPEPEPGARRRGPARGQMAARTQSKRHPRNRRNPSSAPQAPEDKERTTTRQLLGGATRTERLSEVRPPGRSSAASQDVFATDAVSNRNVTVVLSEGPDSVFGEEVGQQGSERDSSSRSTFLHSGPTHVPRLREDMEDCTLFRASPMSVSDLLGPPLRPFVLPEKDKAMLAKWLQTLWSPSANDEFDWFFYRGGAIGAQQDLQTATFCSGKILLGSYMKKPLWVDHSATTVFHVYTSSLSVVVNSRESQLEAGQTFMVPCGHAYSIRNRTTQPAVIFFNRMLAESSD